MDNQIQHLPVTEMQSVENRIANSVKISKQLMKSELDKLVKSLSEEYAVSHKLFEGRQKALLKKLGSEAERQVHMYLCNDGEITRFRNLFSKFSAFNEKDDEDYPKFPSNLSMLKDFSIKEITRTLFLKEHIRDDSEVFQNFLLRSGLAVVELAIPDRFTEEEEDKNLYRARSLGYRQPINFSQGAVDDYFLCDKALNNCNAIWTKLMISEDKLKNIDETVEEMEAQLLVNELNKTEDGRKALEVAGNMVGDILGETPAMLTLKQD